MHESQARLVIIAKRQCKADSHTGRERTVREALQQRPECGDGVLRISHALQSDGLCQEQIVGGIRLVHLCQNAKSFLLFSCIAGGVSQNDRIPGLPQRFRVGFFLSRHSGGEPRQQPGAPLAKLHRRCSLVFVAFFADIQTARSIRGTEQEVEHRHRRIGMPGHRHESRVPFWSLREKTYRLFDHDCGRF